MHRVLLLPCAMGCLTMACASDPVPSSMPPGPTAPFACGPLTCAVGTYCQESAGHYDMPCEETPTHADATCFASGPPYHPVGHCGCQFYACQPEPAGCRQCSCLGITQPQCLGPSNGHIGPGCDVREDGSLLDLCVSY